VTTAVMKAAGRARVPDRQPLLHRHAPIFIVTHFNCV
jgi:hypothetical protein